MKSNYRPKPEFIWNETVTNKKLLHNSLMPYKHAKFVSENPNEFITSSNNGDGTHIATITLQALCKLLISTDNHQKEGNNNE